MFELQKREQETEMLYFHTRLVLCGSNLILKQEKALSLFSERVKLCSNLCWQYALISQSLNKL